MSKAKSTKMVNIDKEYVRKKVKASGFKYIDLAKILGMHNDGSLTGMIAAQRINIDYLKTIARIVDFPYEEAIIGHKPKAYIKTPHNADIGSKLDEVINLQQRINTLLIDIIKQK